MTPTITEPDFWAIIRADDDVEYERTLRGFIAKVHARGDAVCVYRNEDMGHPELGDVKVTSYGSDASMLEERQFPTPPTTLPDIGGQINWRYQLVGVLRP